MDRLDKSQVRVAASSSRMAKAWELMKRAAPLVAIAALYKGIRLLSESVKLAGIQQIADRKLEQALRNTGDASTESAERLKRLARELQSVSNFGDEAIITAQAMLLSFKEVGGAQGAELLTSRLADMAAGVAKATGETSDLNQMALLLGRALTTGSGALTRVGVSLSDAEKAAFDAAQGLERVAILGNIIDSNFKGLAEAKIGRAHV